MPRADLAARAYAARYPGVIADEHQDASALRDAIVRRFGITHVVVLADHRALRPEPASDDSRELQPECH